MDRDELFVALQLALQEAANSTSPMVRADTERIRVEGEIRQLRADAERAGGVFKLTDEEDEMLGELKLTAAGAYTKTIKPK